MISDFKDLDKLFEEINKHLNETVHFFVIGGAILLYHGMKAATKDVDIIVEKEEEFKAIENVLKSIKFVPKIPTIEYRKTNLSAIFIRDDFRIDIFHRTVCGGFSLSNSMKKRSQQTNMFNHLTISLCSHEDILLFKSFTERAGDITDCLAIAQKKKIDWTAIFDEVTSQIKSSGNPVWITWIGERFDILLERGLEIPIMGEINKLREDYFNELERTQVKNQETQK